MGGRGGGGIGNGGGGGTAPSPYGQKGKLYKFTMGVLKSDSLQGITEVPGQGEILTNGGTNPAWFIKEVGSGAVPTINWYVVSRGVNFSYYQGRYVWLVKTIRILYATTNTLNNYNLGSYVIKMEEIPTNGHEIMELPPDP